MSESGESLGGSIGGSIETPCFALLDGKVFDAETVETSPFRIPLTKLPAVLGRSHETDDPNFFGLGSRKALSRKQCAIYYQDSKGGCVEWDKHELVYKEKGTWSFKEGKLKNPIDQLPEEGFFVVECLGRNRIAVNKQKLEQGESIVLESGDAIRISTHQLYFLLPNDAPPRKHLIEQNSQTPSKTKKASGKKRDHVDHSSPAFKKPKTVGLQAYTEQLETLSTKVLLGMMTNAITANTWERKNQMVGTVLVLRAVKDAARAPGIIELSKDNGVARSKVINWIEKSGTYQEFVQQLQSKIEPRSYQAAITKSLLKAAYTRNGTAGRYIKWHLPLQDDDEEAEEEEQEETNNEDESSNQEDQEEAANDSDDNDNQEEDDDEEEMEDNEECEDNHDEDEQNVDEADQEVEDEDQRSNQMESDDAEEGQHEEVDESNHEEEGMDDSHHNEDDIRRAESEDEAVDGADENEQEEGENQEIEGNQPMKDEMVDENVKIETDGDIEGENQEVEGNQPIKDEMVDENIKIETDEYIAMDEDDNVDLAIDGVAKAKEEPDT